MTRERDTFVSACALLLVTTVALLVSGPGLASLSVPDNEQDAATVALVDYTHVGKRIVDDSSRAAPDVAFSTSRFASVGIRTYELLTVRSFSPLRAIASIKTIRAPPIS